MSQQTQPFTKQEAFDLEAWVLEDLIVTQPGLVLAALEQDGPFGPQGSPVNTIMICLFGIRQLHLMAKSGEVELSEDKLEFLERQVTIPLVQRGFEVLVAHLERQGITDLDEITPARAEKFRQSL